MKNQTTVGTLAVTATYIGWGLLSLFWNLLSEVSSVYILAQRIIWSMVFMVFFMILTGKIGEIRELFHHRRNLRISFLAGIFITVNWGVYIYAINSGHVLDASLGYFIEPIIVSVIGMIVFKERLSKWEKVTFFFSVVSLVYMIAVTKIVPVLALIIAGSFAVYGAIKKQITLTAHTSLFAETLLMTPFALAFTVFADLNGLGSYGVLHGASLILLPLCGIVTSVPLLLFNIGVKKIPYYFSGILMYINPTLQFLLGLFYFHEVFDLHRFIAFLIIWIGIAFTIYEKLRLIRSDSAQPENIS